MKNNIIPFLILTLLTGIFGFIGLSYSGIEVVRVLFLIFADLLIISLLSRYFFSGTENMRMERVKK